MTRPITMPSTVPESGWPAPDHIIRRLPILVLFPHNRCNCRCLMCDIWKIRQAREITAEDLEPHVASLRELQVRWVVFSGGEPQMHSDLAAVARVFRSLGIRVTLLTAGLLLEPHASAVVKMVDDVIVSLDGRREIHDAVRSVPNAFERLRRGVEALRRLRPRMAVSGRCTIQKANHASLRDTVRAARSLGLDSISFLAADLASDAFNRPGGWTSERLSKVALTRVEVDELEQEIEALLLDHREDLAAHYIVESPEKLRRIARHFRAALGEVSEVAPRCNAPWVSAVVEADGAVRPCFFHPPLGNLHQDSLATVLNSDRAIDFRRRLDVSSNPICQRCVCSLHLAPESALRAPLGVEAAAAASARRDDLSGGAP